jgi:hypothetical protein
MARAHHPWKVTLHIKVVGPCASGKTVLAAGLRRLGYDARSAAQDHSFVPDMWQRLNPPDILIYLDVTLETARHRGRIDLGWNQKHLDEQHHRLRHARAHCDLYLVTDNLTEEEVLAQVQRFLQKVGTTRTFDQGLTAKEKQKPSP